MKVAFIVEFKSDANTFNVLQHVESIMTELKEYDTVLDVNNEIVSD